MKSKLKEVSFLVPIYNRDVSVCYGGDFEDFRNLVDERHGASQKYSFLDKYEWEDDADATDAYQFHVIGRHGKGERFYIWVHHKTMNLLSHEVFHLTGDIMYSSGIKYCMKSEEDFAYLHGYLMEEIFKLIKGRL